MDDSTFSFYHFPYQLRGVCHEIGPGHSDKIPGQCVCQRGVNGAWCSSVEVALDSVLESEKSTHPSGLKCLPWDGGDCEEDL